MTYVNHETELYHLAKSERVGFFEDMVTVAQALDETFHPDKMNYSLLGNIGTAKGTGGHLHWHLTPRYQNDPLSGQPPLQPHLEIKLRKDEYDQMVIKIRNAINRLSHLS